MSIELLQVTTLAASLAQIIKRILRFNVLYDVLDGRLHKEKRSQGAHIAKAVHSKDLWKRTTGHFCMYNIWKNEQGGLGGVLCVKAAFFPVKLADRPTGGFGGKAV